MKGQEQVYQTLSREIHQALELLRSRVASAGLVNELKRKEGDEMKPSILE